MAAKIAAIRNMREQPDPVRMNATCSTDPSPMPHGRRTSPAATSISTTASAIRARSA